MLVEEIIDAKTQEECWNKNGVWNAKLSMCFKIDEKPKEIVDKVYNVLNKKKCPKPKIELRRQHPTARAYVKSKLITIRSDSWNKMHPAERRFVVIHEMLHICGIPHKEGFRTNIDTVSPMIYEKVYGRDFIIKDYEEKVRKSIEKYVI